jgi:hypothetical protein
MAVRVMYKQVKHLNQEAESCFNSQDSEEGIQPSSPEEDRTTKELLDKTANGPGLGVYGEFDWQLLEEIPEVVPNLAYNSWIELT